MKFFTRIPHTFDSHCLMLQIAFRKKKYDICLFDDWFNRECKLQML